MQARTVGSITRWPAGRRRRGPQSPVSPDGLQDSIVTCVYQNRAVPLFSPWRGNLGQYRQVPYQGLPHVALGRSARYENQSQRGARIEISGDQVLAINERKRMSRPDGETVGPGREDIDPHAAPGQQVALLQNNGLLSFEFTGVDIVQVIGNCYLVIREAQAGIVREDFSELKVIECPPPCGVIGVRDGNV